MRLYAIGDIHGRLDLLERMHERIRTEIERDRPADWRVIHLGDYVDRGPDSRGVIDFLIGAKASDARNITLAGNHDHGFLEFLGLPSMESLFMQNGGVQTAASYGVADLSSGLVRFHSELLQAVPVAHTSFVLSCGYSVSFGDFFFCHAGIRPGVPLYDQDPDDLLWIRYQFLLYPGLHPKVVVHGHTITPKPELLPNRVNVDTGAFGSGVLTAFVVEGAAKRLLTVER
ncbi:serine/threonine protein phosphatase [Pseudaminobacter sp. 19-2017]|uniref:Serine/threonine protein phosphatase n=1 Tax=Pseudaminobacter soli (ex Zhang et al. 2022) TaxID=2831468 RepID=A0A942DZL2_9HYPH|nr:metallophosphoesterase family protein [Pseudaminobacter soli]MBS3648428.1 serine/threonine protein phosphatase [Pseudaminobacter soli]